MFDLTEKINMIWDAGFQAKVVPFITWTPTTMTRLQGYIQTSPRFAVAEGLQIAPFDYNDPHAACQSPWVSNPQMLTAGTWFVTIDDIETEDPGRHWLGILPKMPDDQGFAGAFAKLPQCEPDEPWQRVRWHFENSRVNFDFLWFPPSDSSITTTLNAVQITGSYDPTPDPFGVTPYEDFLIFLEVHDRGEWDGPAHVIRLTYDYHPTISSTIYVNANGGIHPDPSGGDHNPYHTLPISWTPGTAIDGCLVLYGPQLDSRLPGTCYIMGIYFEG
jgi:hypothetical protein